MEALKKGAEKIVSMTPEMQEHAHCGNKNRLEKRRPRNDIAKVLTMYDLFCGENETSTSGDECYLRSSI